MIKLTNHGLKVPLRTAAYEPMGDELFKPTLTEEKKLESFNHSFTKLNNGQNEAWGSC